MADQPINSAPVASQDIEKLRKEVKEILKELDLFSDLSEDEFERSLSGFSLFLLFEDLKNPEWEVAALKNPKLLQKIPVLRDVPRVCNVEKCPYYESCPVMASLSESGQENLRGTKCRADRIYGAELIVGYIKELEIGPNSINELVMVADMVKILLRKRQVSWTISQSVDGLTVDVPHLVAQKTGRVFYRPESHPLLAYELLLEKQLESLRKQFMATRKEKALLNPGNKVASSLMSLLEKARRVDALPDQSISVDYTMVEKEE